jgi:predicted RNase H-like HicB family nuclease
MRPSETIAAIDAQYVCAFRPEAEGGYTVRCPAFPELITHGATLEEARGNAREALQHCLDVYQDKGWPLPPSDAAPRGTIKELVPVKRARA